MWIKILVAVVLAGRGLGHAMPPQAAFARPVPSRAARDH
jgi:hypothetical protein